MYQEHADFPWELNAVCRTSRPVCGRGQELCGRPGAQGEHWGASGHVGEEECRHGRIGKTLHGYREMLAEKADIGSYLANEGKGSGSLSW